MLSPNSCAPVLALAQLRRIEKAPLNNTPDAVHGALADLAGLTLGLEFGRRLVEELVALALVDRRGQCEQQVPSLRW